MVKDKHKFNSQSERRDSGESVSANTACELLIPKGVRGCSEILHQLAILTPT